MLSRVLIAGGGTGGHLYPGLAIAERLRSLGAECRFLGTRRGLEARVVPERGFPLHTVHARGLAGKPWQKLLALATLGRGFLESLWILNRYQPQMIVATGGYVCAPVLLASAFTRTPVLMLEQNALPGKVNRKLARLARRICLSFEESRKFFPSSRCILTGNPVREEILTATREQAREFLQIPEDRRVLLVTGASQGAASINEALLKALPAWREGAHNWTLLHLTGPAHQPQVQEKASQILQGSMLDYRCIGYMGEMHFAYAAADLVVSRAGATTLAELSARGLPSILIPYPWSAERHQDFNADTLVQRGAALKLDDSNLGELLGDAVSSLMEDSQRLGKMAQASLASGRPKAMHAILEVIEQHFGVVAKKSPLG